MKDFKEGWILCIIVFGKLIIGLKYLEWGGGFLIELGKLGGRAGLHGRKNELCFYLLVGFCLNGSAFRLSMWNRVSRETWDGSTEKYVV